MSSLTAMSTDQIETSLVEMESTIGRLRAAQVELLGEIDRRQVPLADGCRSLVEWVASRLDVAPETGRVLGRMARTEAPAVRTALQEGEATFDRAAELVRLTNLDAAAIHDLRRFDIPGLRRHVARRRRVSRVDEQDVFDRRHLVIQPNLDGSEWHMWGLLPGLEGSLVDQVLTGRAERFPAAPEGMRATKPQRKADALVAVCQDHASGDADGVAASVTVFVDAAAAATTDGEAGAEIVSGPRVGPLTIEKILCGGAVEVTAVTDDGTPLAIGRRSKVVPPRLRRFVLWRDGGCTIDGCTSRYRLEAHHVVPYSEGGSTDASNLTTLCWFHHHVVVHGMGYRIDPAAPPQRRRFLATARGDPP